MGIPQDLCLTDWQRHTAAAEGPAVFANLPAVYLRGARLHAITERRCINLILDSLDQMRGGSVSTMNLDHLRRFVRDVASAEQYHRATIITADGMPLIWASNLQGTPLPERVCGSNLVSSLSAAAAVRGRSIFLLGGAPGAAQNAAAVLSQRHPNLRIAGVSGEPYENSGGNNNWRNIAEALAAARPDIVYVGLGSPLQQELIESLRATLPHAWWLGVGISFSFVGGLVPRAPRWMQSIGLEWCHRLLMEPRRLARRYLIDDLPFALTLFGSSIAKRFSHKRNIRKP